MTPGQLRKVERQLEDWFAHLLEGIGGASAVRR